jgi:S1-C subfamily serine protease
LTTWLAPRAAQPQPQHRAERAPADRPGLRADEVILAIGTAPPPDTAALAARPGDRIILTIKRDSQHLTAQVTLGELPGS